MITDPQDESSRLVRELNEWAFSLEKGGTYSSSAFLLRRAAAALSVSAEAVDTAYERAAQVCEELANDHADKWDSCGDGLMPEYAKSVAWNYLMCAHAVRGLKTTEDTK